MVKGSNSRPDEDDRLSTVEKLARIVTHSDDIEIRFGAQGPAVEGNVLVLPDSLREPSVSVDILTGYMDMLAARRLHCNSATLDGTTTGTRLIAQVVDDWRAVSALAESYPGARSYLSSFRRHTESDVLQHWTELPWIEKVRWRIERILWDEQPTTAEQSASLDSTLHLLNDLLERSKSSSSTGESIRLAEQIVQRVAAFRSGKINNMMFTSSGESHEACELAEGLDWDSRASDSSNDTLDGPPSHASAVSDASDPVAKPSGDADALPTSVESFERPLRSIPITTQFDQITDLTGQGDPTIWRKMRAAARAQTGTLKARLERALKVDEQTHWKREQERGELDRSSLARLATSPAYRTPFRSRYKRPGRDAAVTLLLDLSGSMAGRKIELARMCVAAISDALVQLGFPCEVLGYSSIEDAGMRAFHEQWLAAGHSPRGFNRFVERLDLRVFKRFDSGDLSGLACIECGHENPDGEALAWAADRLLSRRAHRHILMVLQDGYPATGDGNPAILRTDLLARIADLHARGVELIGVGILADAVETFYPTAVVVERLLELPTAAFSVLGQTLLSRRNWMLEPQ
ncbi:putative cobalamin biosynthesis protein, CobT [Caballeronia hypogeia]|uniref:Cobalamin biosynthesis protein, CobT n=1 Tax=Caballeronia hypogeia TaxID=1777140 RepID=A0A158CC07_9BURK|nr:cobalamin biosynthesis protein CobT [Caballeronia hypogeia]SAK79898.1 putative cobalamin biosynthesis protein, CobT [Caballeronia hypogeia]